MKITFIYPDLNLGKFNFGVGYLSSVLKAHGHHTDLVHLKDYINEETFTQALRQKNPDLIAFSCSTNMFAYTKQLVSWARRCLKDTPIICGGIHPTLCPEEVIGIKDVDMVCVGEGEEALLELCDNLRQGKTIDNIENIWLKKNGNIYRNPVRPLIADLDSLPFPDRDMFTKSALTEDEALNACAVMASRGCPYDCSYCCNHALKNTYQGKGPYVRFKAVSRVMDEIEEILKKHNFDAIIFHDDIMPFRKDWLTDFSKEYKARIGLPFICNLRVDLADQDSLRMLKEAGCIQVCLGIESGNEFIRNAVMRRKISDRQIADAFGLCRKLGIRTKSFNMVGLPFEDMEKILDTIKLNVAVRPDVIQVSIFYPYPKTELFKLCAHKNLISQAKNLVSYFDGSILSLPRMSQEQVYFARKRFVRMYKRYSFYKKLPQFIGNFLEKISDLIFKLPLTAKTYVLQRNFSQAIKSRRKKRAGGRRVF